MSPFYDQGTRGGNRDGAGPRTRHRHDHGGAVLVDSVVGQGTTFTVYLPCSAEPGTGRGIPGGGSLRTGLILGQSVCSSSMTKPALVRLGEAILQRLGYEVVVCTSSIEALEVFRAAPQRFDLVITDQTMPHMTGERLAQALRRLRSDIPIILCTGFSHVMHAERAQELGIDAFLMKPLAMQELAQTIQQVMAARRLTTVLSALAAAQLAGEPNICRMAAPRLQRQREEDTLWLFSLSSGLPLGYK